MQVKIYFLIAAMLLLTAKSDPGPLSITVSTPVPFLLTPSQQDPKQVVVYLTPDQITNLQRGQEISESETESQPEEENENEKQEQAVDQQEVFVENRPYVIIQQKKVSPAPVKEPNQEKLEEEQTEDYKYGHQRPITVKKSNKYNAPTPKRLENKRYFVTSTEAPEYDYYSTTEKQEESDYKSYSYYRVQNEKKGDNINIKIIHPNPKHINTRDNLEEKELEGSNNPILQQSYKLIPNVYEYISRQQSDVESIKKPGQGFRVSEKGKLRKLDLVFTQIQNQEESRSQENDQEDSTENEQILNKEFESKYLSNYKKRVQAQKILGLLKKQSAQTEAEATKRPVLKEVSKPSDNTVLRPYKFLIPQPVDIKVSQPYPVPLEIVRHIPIEIQENDQEEKQVPYKVEKHLPTSGRRVYDKVDRPFLVERIVPVDRRKEVSANKPQRWTILGSSLKYYS